MCYNTLTFSEMSNQSCIIWDVEAGLKDFCSCPDCVTMDLLELPFSGSTRMKQKEDHPNFHDDDYAKVTQAARNAENVILRLLTFEKLCPGMTRIYTNDKIIKHYILITSITMYDAKIMSYNGPEFWCTCAGRQEACNAVKRLASLCVVTNIDANILWSYLEKPPKMSVNIIKFK